MNDDAGADWLGLASRTDQVPVGPRPPRPSQKKLRSLCTKAHEHIAPTLA
jgi:hypothetical protein